MNNPFDNDRDALHLLFGAGYRCRRGVLFHPHNPVRADKLMTPMERHAIDYLCDEWDYGYSPKSDPDE